MTQIRMELRGNKSYYTGLVGNYRDEIEGYLAVAIQNTETDAIQAAPSNTGILRSSSYSEIEGLDGVVGFKALYAAFLEFGTGTMVDAPAEWEEYAQTFANQKIGTFEDFKNSLLDWMRNKGIAPEFFYPIMLKVLRIGIRPQPFLYPAWKKNSEAFLNNLRKMLVNGTK